MESLEKRLQDFKKFFDIKLQALIAKSLDDYTKTHHNNDLPVDEFMALVQSVSISLSLTLHKNLTISSVFFGDPELGRSHLDALVNCFNQEMENFEGLQDQLIELVTESATTHSVH